MESWVQLARWEDAVDIATVAVLLWVAIRYLRRTRARAATAGLVVLALVYAAATGLDLRLTAAIFQAFFAAVVIVLVVVFQEDIRRFLEQLGSWRPTRSQPPDHSEGISLLVRVMASLADQRTGALIVLPRNEPLERHVDGGVVLNGRVSEPLLLSLFDASSPGHDGAVVIRDDLVERFAAHLPLSANRDLLGARGTRHAAALGLVERCDALCVVVSEETGRISLARDGQLRTLSAQSLASELLAIDSTEAPEVPRWRRGAWLEAAAAIAAAVAVWLVVVPGSDVDDLVVPAKIEITNLPNDLALESITPDTVDVALRGLRRDLVLAPEAVTVRVDGYLTRFGRRTFSLSNADVLRPASLAVVEIAPDKIRLSLEPVEVAEVPSP